MHRQLQRGQPAGPRSPAPRPALKVHSLIVRCLRLLANKSTYTAPPYTAHGGQRGGGGGRSRAAPVPLQALPPGLASAEHSFPPPRRRRRTLGDGEPPRGPPPSFCVKFAPLMTTPAAMFLSQMAPPLRAAVLEVNAPPVIFGEWDIHRWGAFGRGGTGRPREGGSTQCWGHAKGGRAAQGAAHSPGGVPAPRRTGGARVRQAAPPSSKPPRARGACAPSPI